MHIDNRNSHPAKLQHAHRIRHLFSQNNAVYAPDIAFELSAGFLTIRTASRPTDRSMRIAYQAVATAIRPSIVSFLRNTLVHLGQQHMRCSGFKQTERAECPQLPEDLVNSVKVESTGYAANGPVSLALDGPRHVGKSHILLQLAVLLASEPGVVVALISDCGNLLLDETEYDRSRYVRLIEYFACILCEYPKAVALIEDWYTNTRMSTDMSTLYTETKEFFMKLHTFCDANEITLVVILDNYEKLAAAAHPDRAILSLSDLTERYGAHVVAAADPVFVEKQKQPFTTHRCIMAAPLTHVEAQNLYAATSGNLGLSREDQDLVFRAAEMLPLDIVRTLARYENNRAVSAVADRSKSIHSAICEQQVERSARVAQMHMYFVGEKLAATAKAMNFSEENKQIVMTKGVINTKQSKGLAPEMSMIRQASFTMFHDIPPRKGSIYDCQFIANLDNSEAPQCIPMAARDTIYHAHFTGSVENQFEWIYASAQNKFHVDEVIRLRYFDYALLDTAQFAGSAINPLSLNGSKKWKESVEFVIHKTTSLLGDSRLTKTFDEAIELAMQFIAANRELQPDYAPHSTSKRTVKSTTVMPLPLVRLNESWIPSRIRTAPGSPGTFMLAITRTDIFDNSQFVRCEFGVTWMANDPLCITGVAPDGTAIDYDTKYGPIQSWSAKAIRLFPELLRRYDDKLDIDGISRMRLLALVPSARIRSLVEQGKELRSECGIGTEDHQHPLACSSGVGLLAFDTMGPLGSRNISHYV